jgi:predicted peroxiredoxin
MPTRSHIATLLLLLALIVPSSAANNSAPLSTSKASILIQVTHGPENPTRAALAFLVARTALEQGHTVTLFLAGDAVQLLREGVIENLAGLGTGRLREHYDAIVKAGGRFYLSGGSSKARGLTAADLNGRPAEFGTPEILLQLSLSHDRMFTY